MKKLLPALVAVLASTVIGLIAVLWSGYTDLRQTRLDLRSSLLRNSALEQRISEVKDNIPIQKMRQQLQDEIDYSRSRSY